MRQVISLGLLALLIVALFASVPQAQSCTEIPPGPFIVSSRFVAYRIEGQGQTGQCWVTNRVGYEHQQLCDYIASLDSSAACLAAQPVISPLSPPRSPIYLPIVVRNR